MTYLYKPCRKNTVSAFNMFRTSAKVFVVDT